LASEKQQWQFPDDVILNRAMIEALINVLIKRQVIDFPELRKEFDERFRAYIDQLDGPPVAPAQPDVQRESVSA
jgi:hypothetical protein